MNKDLTHAWLGTRDVRTLWLPRQGYHPSHEASSAAGHHSAPEGALLHVFSKDLWKEVSVSRTSAQYTIKPPRPSYTLTTPSQTLNLACHPFLLQASPCTGETMETFTPSADLGTGRGIEKC